MDDTRNANVNLTANVDQYQTQMAASAKQTNVVTEAVNKLSASLDGISKKVGKKLIIFAAADAVAMTAYTAAAAKYEKQLTTLSAQTVVADKNMDLYRAGIAKLARDLPITGTQVTALVTQISKLGVTSEKQALGMARVFANLAAATGEDIGTLTQGLIELSRQMGTLSNGAQGISNFADTLTTISTNAGVSATQVLNFAQSIAPMARAAGVGQKELLGISTAFTKAGADGFAAANTFNTVISDITRQAMTGSPELAKYASAVGMTVDQFKQLGPVEQFTQLVETVGKAGPDAARVLDKIGLDGIRAAKSIQALANEQGGLRKAIQDSVGAYGGGSTQKGADEAFASLDAATTRLRNNLEQMAASIGEKLVPVATAFVNVMNKGLEIINQMAGPLLNVAGLIGGLLAPVAAGFGALMSAMGPLSTVMMAMTLFRLSPMRAGIQGLKEGMLQTTAAKAGASYVPFTQAGRINAGQVMGPDGSPRALKFYQQGPFRAGESLGRLFPPMQGGPSPLGQYALRGGVAGLNAVNTWYADPTKVWYANAAKGDPFGRTSMTGDMLQGAYTKSQTMGGTIGQALRNPYTYMMARGGQALPTQQVPMSPLQPPPDVEAGKKLARGKWQREYIDGGGTQKSLDQANKVYAEHMAQVEKQAQAAKVAAEAQKDAAATAKAGQAASAAQIRTMGDLRSAAGRAARGLVGIPLAAGQMAGTLGMQAAGKVGGGLLGSIGNMVGMGAPGGAAIVGVGALAYGLKQRNDETYRSIIGSDTQLNVGPTNTALGLATETIKKFTSGVSDGTRSITDLHDVIQATNLTSAERRQALGRETVDKRVEGLTSSGAAVAFMQSMGKMDPQAARSLMQDMFKQFGPVASQQIQAQYAKQARTTDKYSMGMDAITEPLYASARQNANNGWQGGLRSLGTPTGMLAGNALAPVLGPLAQLAPIIGSIIPGDSNATDQVQAAWVASMQQVGDVQAKYGDKAAAGKEMANVSQLLTSGLSDLSTPGGRQVAEQTFKQLEATLLGGKQLNADISGAGIKIDGQTISTSQDLFRSMMTGSSEGAKAFQTRAKEAGLTAADFAATGGKSLDETAIRLQRGNMSDYERNIRNQEGGTFARTNKQVLAVTEGSQVGDPKAVGAAVDAMVGEITKGGNAFTRVTEISNRLANASGSASDYLYQLAMQAKGLANLQGQNKASNYGFTSPGLDGKMVKTAAGPTAAAILTHLGTIQDLKDQLKDGDRPTNEAAYAQQNQAFIDQAKSFDMALINYQTSTQRSTDDFHTQMIYSQEDFAKNMRRASEDAAKSIYEPFQRVFSPGAISGNTLIDNLKDQNKKIGDQMKQLADLKKMGLSQQAIDTLQLTDPQKWAQVQKLWEEGDPKSLKKITKLTGVRGDLATQWTAGQQSTKRAEEDFATQQERARKQFDKSINRMLEDWTHYQQVIAGGFGDTMKDIHTRMKEAFPDGWAKKIPAFQFLLDIAEKVNPDKVNADKPYNPGSGASSTEYQKPIYQKLPGGATAISSQSPIPIPSPPRAGMPSNPHGNPWGVDPSKTSAASSPTVGDVVARNKAQVAEMLAMSNLKAALPKNWNDMSTGGRLKWVSRHFHLKMLGDGGGIDGQTLAMLGERSEKEVVVPLNQVGRKWMTGMYQDVSNDVVKGLRTSGHATPSVYRGHSTHIVNNETNFRIEKVVAQDVVQLERQLKERAARTRARQGANAPV